MCVTVLVVVALIGQFIETFGITWSRTLRKWEGSINLYKHGGVFPWMYNSFPWELPSIRDFYTSQVKSSCMWFFLGNSAKAISIAITPSWPLASFNIFYVCLETEWCSFIGRCNIYSWIFVVYGRDGARTHNLLVTPDREFDTLATAPRLLIFWLIKLNFINPKMEMTAW